MTAKEKNAALAKWLGLSLDGFGIFSAAGCRNYSNAQCNYSDVFDTRECSLRDRDFDSREEAQRYIDAIGKA